MKLRGVVLAAVLLSSIGACVAGAVDNVAVINGFPVIFADPATAQDWYDTQVMYNLYSPLVYPSADGSIEPHLATAWVPVEGDLSHWRFTIREGVLFHDGTELTAEDVKFSMDRLMALDAGFSGTIGAVTTTIVEDYVVDFQLTKPNAVFPEVLTLFWPVNRDLVVANLAEGDYGDMGDYGQTWLADHDAGTGPYTLVSHSPGERLEAARYVDYFEGWDDEYWAESQVPIERLIFIMETDSSTLMSLLRNGQLDLEVNGGFSNQQFQEIIDDADLRLNLVWSQDLTVWMNTQRPPFDDVHFRRAVRQAFDYESLLSVYEPYGAREGGVILSSMPGFVNIDPQPREQDLGKAQAALNQSPYDPADVTLEFHYCAGLGFEEEVGLQLQADLSLLGIDVNVAGPPWPQYSASCYNLDETPHMVIMLFPSVYPTADFFITNMYHPDNVGGIYATHWYSDEELGAMIDQARLTVEFDERVTLYEEIQERIGDLALAFYPYEKQVGFASQQYLIGPKNVYEMVGPNVNMHNWRIDLGMKEG